MSGVDDVFREHRARVLANLIGFLGDFDLAEEAVQDAFAAAVERWPRTGIPRSPAAWLITAARNRAIDRIRRERTFQRRLPELAAADRDYSDPTDDLVDDPSAHIPDERLELIFTCCHPALSTEAQVALTLRTLGGLDTPAIARAFLVTPETMKRRLTRAKAKITLSGVPFRVPAPDRLPARLDAVLAVVYLIFNQGYAGSEPLAEEAIRLGKLLASLMPREPEALGLLALMELHHGRRAARRGPDGELVLMADQDRRRWDAEAVERGRALVVRAARMGPAGQYTLQAQIAAQHYGEPVDWPAIAELYERLVRLTASPVVELSRAVAIAEAGSPATALELVDAPAMAALDGYQYLHSTRGELLARLGRRDEARAAFARALELAAVPAERRFLERRVNAL